MTLLMVMKEKEQSRWTEVFCGAAMFWELILTY